MAAGQTIIIYGGLTFFNVLTRHFSDEAMYDDTNTDEIGRKFTISAIGHIHGLPAALMGAIPTTGTGDAGLDLVQLRWLMAPRQHFEMRLGVTLDQFGNILSPGTPILICDPANVVGSTNVNLCDINNGPKAHAINVTKIAGDTLLTCELEFEICQLQCAPDSSTANQSGILNNRWTVIDDVDCKNWMTTRTTTGKLRLSSAQVNPHSFRHLVIPPLQMGMRRARMNFAAAEDGLSLMYSIVDEEIAFAPPAPATTWNATFTQRIEYGESLGHFYDASIIFGGDRNCDLKKLISIASAMALAKFSNGVPGALRGNQDPTYRVTNIEVTEHYTDKDAGISFRATAQRTDFQGPDMLGLNTTNLGVPIRSQDITNVVQNYDARLSRGLRTGESLEMAGPISLVAAFSSFLQSGCGINFGISNGLPAQIKGQPGGSATTIVSASVTNDIPPDGTITNVYGNANNQGIYTYGKIQTERKRDMGRAILPSAPPQQSLGSSGSGPFVPGGVPIDLHPPIDEFKADIEQERIGPMPNGLKIGDAPDGSVKITGKHETILAPSFTPDGKKINRKKTTVWWWQSIPDGFSYPGGTDPSYSRYDGWIPFGWITIDVTPINPPSSLGQPTPPQYQQGF